MKRFIYEQDGIVRKEFEMNNIYVDYIRNYPLKVTAAESLPFPKTTNSSNTLPYLDPSGVVIDEYVVYISASTTVQGVYIPADSYSTATTSGIHPDYDPATDANHTPVFFVDDSSQIRALHHTAINTLSSYLSWGNGDTYTYFQNPVAGAVACIVKGRTS